MTGLMTQENHRLHDRPWPLLGVVFFFSNLQRLSRPHRQSGNPS